MEDNWQIDSLLLNLKGDTAEHDFKRLYDLLYNRFFRIAVYYLHREEHAQEVVLDVFLTLWNKREDLSSIGNFESYCFILLKNASLNYLSKHKQINNSFDSVSEPEHSATPEDDLINEELLLVYINTLEQLPPRCREVFILLREQGLSYKQVAEQLNISTKTVDAQLQKAVSILKEKIKSYFS